MKHLEIERKFLLRPCSLKKFLKRHGLPYRAVPIEQFYLRSDGNGSERYRRAGDRYIHTVKSAGGLVREEREEAVDEATYRRFRAQAASGLIEKTRYLVPFRGLTYELDAFHGALKGLRFLEVEFETLEAAEAFTLPDPFARLLIAEVSSCPAFTNGALARTLRLPTLSEGWERIRERLDARKHVLKASTAVEFGPYEESGIAVRALLYTLLAAVEANRRAILKGSADPERLHQLRVAMRKMRVIFDRFPELFAEAWRREHGTALEMIMRTTGPLRDLDVALERIPEYRRMLEGRYPQALERLERVLKERRDAEAEDLRSFLARKRVERELAALRALAGGEAVGILTERGKDPILPLAVPKLKRLHGKCLNAGRKLGKDSPRKAYHRMRIRIKKLRYLLEFFAATLDGKAAAEMLENLKRVQSVLGEYQDLTVQRGMLAAWEGDALFSGGKEAAMLKALDEALEREAQKRRARFHAVFDAFPDKTMLRRVICRD